MIQGSTEWLTARRSGIGGSDASIIMGEVPWGTPYKLWKEKLGLGEAPVETERMKRGKDLEPFARDAFVKSKGIHMEPKTVWSSSHPWMFGSLDGISPCGKYILEIKCPGEKDHQCAKDGQMPLKYRAQVQHYLAVTGAEMCYYYSYDGAEGVIVEVKPDELYIARLIEAEQAFWALVENFKAPPMQPKDYEIREDEEWKDAVGELASLEDLMKSARETIERYEAAKERVISLCGSSSTRGLGYTVLRSVSPGRIDYKSVPALQDVNLENYRKEPIVSWRITQEKL